MSSTLAILIPLSAIFVTSAASAATKAKQTVTSIESPAYVQSESARLIVPAQADTTRRVRVLLVTVVPFASGSCYQASAEVNHLDRFTHVISARARAYAKHSCDQQRSRFDFQALDLGLLAAGSHVIRVEDSVVALPPTVLDVREGAMASNL